VIVCARARVRAFYRFCIVQIALASLYSILLGTSFVNIEDKDTNTHKIPAYTCLLGGKDTNTDIYCNHVALTCCRDSAPRSI